MEEEAILPFHPDRAGVPPLTQIRSTIIGSSILSLRARGLEDRYQRFLDPVHKDAILYSPAGLWLPVSIAIAHYAACDALALDEASILDIGKNIARATQRAALASILRLSREAGTTPWVLYPKCDKFWGRIFDGSALGIFKVGPKDARFEVVGSPLAASPYWRAALRGLIIAMTEAFAHRAYARELASMLGPTTCGVRVSWA